MKKFVKLLGSTWGQRLSIIVVLMLIMAFAEPAFFTLGNFKSLLIQIAIYGIMACGMLFVILVGGIDFSIGRMGALACVITASYIVNHGTSNVVFFTALGLSLLVAVCVGLLHGVLDAVFKLPSFIVTLATQYILYGVANEVTSGVYIHAAKPEGIYYMLGSAKIFGLSPSVFTFIVVAIVTGIILDKTTYGSKLHLAGGNPVAAKIVGINPQLMKITSYIVCSIAASIGGVLLSAQNISASYTTASGYEGTVLMVIVVGGISMLGGIGTVSGVLFGAILVGMMNNMIILLGINTDYAEFVQGVVIIIAVALNIYTSNKSQSIIDNTKKQKDSSTNKDAARES